MNDRQIFSGNKVNKSTTKYFIIAFSIFIVLLAIGSVALLMYSLDFDLSNLIETTTEQESDISDEQSSMIYSVNDLSGKSNLLFIVEDDENAVNFMCVVSTDYDNKSMTVNCINSNDILSYNGDMKTVSEIYYKEYENGIQKSLLETVDIKIDKYAIFTSKQLNDVLTLFDGYSITVQDSVNYKSNDFNLSLDTGKQELSGDLTYKYLMISDNKTREKIICDIITSVLIPSYADNSQKLFTSFVNLCDTNISVIDYSDNIDRIATYSYSTDKFLPQVYVEGDK